MRIPFIFTAALLLPAALCAQSRPDMQQILERLQKLEDQNREMMAEIHALREALAGAPTAPQAAQVPPPSGPEPTPDTHLDERVAVNEQRIKDQDQSKVEAEHKLPIRLSGMLLFNAFTNGRNGGGQEYPVVAAATPGASPSDGGLCARAFSG